MGFTGGELGSTCAPQDTLAPPLPFGTPAGYRDTSLIRKYTLLEPYRSLCLGSWGGPRSVGVFL